MMRPAAKNVSLLPFLLVPILTQALLTLVRGNLMTFTFATARHELYRWLYG